MHEVVIAGGGIAGAECLLALRDLVGERAHLTLITPVQAHPIEALAPAAAFGFAEPSSIPIDELCAFSGARLILASVTALDAVARSFTLASGETLAYDAAVLALGARSAPTEGADLTYMGSTSAAELEQLAGALESGAVRSVAVIVPPGNGWTLPAYELAMLLADRSPAAAITLLTPEPAALYAFGPHAGFAIGRLLAERQVSLRTNVFAEPAGNGALRLMPGDERLTADRIVALPSALAPAVEGLPADGDGFVVVDQTQRVRGTDGLYAIGDCTAFPIKQGGLAAEQADVAAADLARALGADIAPQRFRPVMRGKLVAGPDAVFLRNPALGGDGEGVIRRDELWRPPAKIWGHYLPQWLASAGIAV